MPVGASAAAALALSALTFAESAPPTPANPPIQEHLGNALEPNEAKVLKILIPLAPGGARLTYEADCTHGSEPVGFPALDVRQPPAGLTGIDAVRAAFQGVPAAKIARDGGLITVTVGAPPTAILRTRLRRADLTSHFAQIDPNNAIDALLGSPDLVASARRLGVGEPLVLVSHMVASTPGVRLPGELRDTTLDQGLDEIARTFKGVVLYGACLQPPLFDMTFQPMP